MQAVRTQLHLLWKPIDRRLDRLGMYRVVTIALSALAVCALGFGAIGLVPYSVPEQAISLILALATALGANYAFARGFGVHANHESAVITALILHFLVLPAMVSDIADHRFIILTILAAIASKYLITVRKQHILNPAAAGAAIVFLYYEFAPIDGFFEPLWWAGTPALFIPLLFLGALVVTKVRRWGMVLSFLGVGFAVSLIEGWRFAMSTDAATFSLLTETTRFWLSGPSVFLAAFMLTEPFTTPPTQRLRWGYGGVVGVLSQTTLLSGFVPMTPSIALLIGNAAFFPFSLRRKLFLTFREKREVAAATWEFLFAKPDGVRFKPGQYLEWMLPHEGSDSRGERRYFTIASAPSEEHIRLVVRFVENGSSYKERLKQLRPGEQIIASQLAGDFLLPDNPHEKLGFIAGGIGVTPYLSHLEHLRHVGDQRDVHLYYCNNTTADIAYEAFFRQVSGAMPLKLINVIAKEAVAPPYERGFIDATMLERHTPDFRERIWYLSGPPPMVNAYHTLLREQGIPEHRIVRDFFPGLA